MRVARDLKCRDRYISCCVQWLLGTRNAKSHSVGALRNSSIVRVARDLKRRDKATRGRESVSVRGDGDEGCSGPETPRPAGFRPCCCEGFSGPETPRRRVCPPPRASGGEGCLGPEMPRRSTNVVIPKVVWDLRCQDHDDPLGRALPVAAPVDGCLEPEMPRRLTTVLYQRLFGT